LNYFNALSEDHETEFVGLVGLMRQAMGNQDQTLLLELTKKAYRKRPESAFVCETLFSLQTKMADWENAQKTLMESVRRKVKAEKVAASPRVTIYTARAIEFKNNDMILEAIKYADKALTDNKNFIPAAILRAKLTQDPEKERKVIRSLEAVISVSPHRELTMNYLKLCSKESPLQHFQRLQQLLIKSEKSVQARLILAEIALEAELWGEARKHLGDISVDDITSHGCRLMARLEQRERNDEIEARRWLEKSINAVVDYSWTCNSCGAIGEEWSPLCGNCNCFDLITWKIPPRVSTLSNRVAHNVSDEQAQVLEQ
jgi:HemY protein